MVRGRSPMSRCWPIRRPCSGPWRRTRRAGDCWINSTLPGWALTGQAFPPAKAAGRELPGLVIDLDASIVVCHSEKEQAAATFKKTFGSHPLLAFCDNTGEFLAARLRKGNAGSNTAVDHITVLDGAL